MKAAWMNIMRNGVMGMALVALCVAAGSGCATRSAQTATAQPEGASVSNVERYRRAVSANAERNNVLVQWVNPPEEKDLEKWAEDEEER